MSENEIDALARRLAEEIETRRQSRNGNNVVNALAEKLRLNIGTAVTIIIAIASAAYYFATEVQSIKAAIAESGRDKWRRSHQRLWADELQYKNQTLVVPDPINIIERINRAEQEHQK